jgi:hypothetical protein
VCSVDSCTAPAKGRGLCSKHLQRLANHGDPNYVPERDKTLPERVWGRLEVADCWEWRGAHSEGYGTIWNPEIGKVVKVHRWVWEHLVGPIPAGKQLDHLCRNRGCANPDHLSVVTPRENVRRGASGKLKPRATVCPQGHTYRRSPSGKPVCYTCENTWRRERYRRRVT